jgi:hypothetical protein
MSSIHVDPELAVEIFVLEPVALPAEPEADIATGAAS